jgi:3-isopropylmalate dehydrogenase
MFRIVSLPGDGIGPEVTAAALGVMELAASRFGFGFEVVEHLVGGAAIDAVGDPLPSRSLEACRTADAVFLGAVGGPKWSGGGPRPEQGLLKLRSELGLFANLRPVRVMPGLEAFSPLRDPDGMDLMIVRELTGGLYFGAKEEGSEAASDLCPYSKDEVERLARIGFELASSRRGRLASVDTANVLATSRLWRRTVDAVSADYPDVEVEHVLVDAMSMHLVTRPGAYDVIVTENLFGDILSDEAAAISGSIGLAASASLGAAGAAGLYEPVHGSAPDIAGTGAANPLGAILSGALLLRRSAGRPDIGEAIESAVETALASGVRTRDLGGTATTDEMTSAVASALAS